MGVGGVGVGIGRGWGWEWRLGVTDFLDFLDNLLRRIHGELASSTETGGGDELRQVAVYTAE